MTSSKSFNKPVIVLLIAILFSLLLSACRHDNESSSDQNFGLGNYPDEAISAVYDSTREVYRIAALVSYDLIAYVTDTATLTLACSTSGTKEITYLDSDSDGTLNSGDEIAIVYTWCRDDFLQGTASGNISLQLSNLVINSSSAKPEISSDIAVSITDFSLKKMDSDVTFNNARFTLALNYNPSTKATLLTTSDEILVNLGANVERLTNLKIAHNSNYTTGIFDFTVDGDLVSQNRGGTYKFNTSVPFSQHFQSQQFADGIIDIEKNGTSTLRLVVRSEPSYYNTFVYYIDQNLDGVFEQGPTSLSFGSNGNLIPESLQSAMYSIFSALDVAPNTIPGNQGPFYVTGITPANNATGIDISAPVVYTFNNPVLFSEADPPTLRVVEVADGQYFQSASVEATNPQPNQLAFDVGRVIEHNTLYTFTLNSIMTDILGNSIFPSITNSSVSYTTTTYTQLIDVGRSLRRLVYDDINNIIYGIDNVNKNLLSIDLATKTVSKIFPLVYVPDDLCFDAANSRVFIVNTGSSFISEFSIASSSVTRNISWPAPIDSYPNSNSPPHYRIKCLTDTLVLADANGRPGLWTVDLTAVTPIATSKAAIISSLGDFAITADENNLFYWKQSNWYSPRWSGVTRIDFGVPALSKLDSSATNIGYLIAESGYVPMFLDEINGLVINHRYVFSLLNLSQMHYTFPVGEVIYAVDLTKRRAASRSTVYDLRNYNPILALPTKKATQMVFASDGTLYMMVNEQSEMYYVATSP